ncbi:MAG: DUF2092 domain-containing protein [Desulfobulbaceae bacterium]|nr:DUF2092 domain-containing protein [Desulfobulbaceae bacterium]
MSYVLKPIHRGLVFCLLFSCCLLSSTAWAETQGVEPKADALFKQMSVYLAGLHQFEISSQSTIETMLDSGQKIMLDYSSLTSVKRPDKLLTTRKGSSVEQSFYYDGKAFTSFDHLRNQYQVVAAPATLSAALDVALEQFELTAPGADLLYPNSYDRLSKGLIDGFYVGTSFINGIECHHLAFRNGAVDWQIWIQTGDRPLPIKYVITSRWITGAPQFSVLMKWNVKPDLSDDIFRFAPPATATKLQ